MTELREKLNNIVEDYNACKVLAESVGNPSVYEGTTATAGDIIKGKTAYSDGEFIEGTLVAGNAIVDMNWEYDSNFATKTLILKHFKKFDGELKVSGTSAQSFFRDFPGLIEVPYFDSSKITNFNYFCMNCKSLTTVPALNLSSATETNYMFSGCSVLESVPNFNTPNVTNFGEMFNACPSLRVAPELNTSSGHVFMSMFSGCTNLQEVPVYNFSGITWRQTNALQEMFKNCTSLSDDALNNIMASLMTADGLESYAKRSMKYAGLTQEQAERCKSLPNWEAYTAKGLITGY